MRQSKTGHDTRPPSEETVKITLTIPPELAQLVERYRNYIPRNAWIIVAMVEKLQREGRLPEENLMET